MAPLTLDFIEKLPKTDLHCHLDGSLRIETILDLAQKQKVKLPAEDPDKLFKMIYAGKREEAIMAVPDDFADEISIVGPPSRIKERLEAWRDSPVTTLMVAGRDPEQLEVVRDLVLG